MTFKEKLVILRKTRGLTQDEFASAVGVSRQAVYKWECGQSYPEVPKLLEIKTLFSISIDALLDDNFDIPLPEKKKRKRISKEAKERIEKNVEKTDGFCLCRNRSLRSHKNYLGRFKTCLSSLTIFGKFCNMKSHKT